ncbi:MAG: Transcription termination/antitermination protein NusA, partial [Patescibacteria group bacterium]|nr:Transcription termination/antitermination protein NusA [Patescibacteria group bacterium]
IEAAIKTAYKKDFGNKDSNVNVKIDVDAGTIEIGIEKTVVETVENPETEISLEDLGEDAEGFSLGDTIEIDVTDDVVGSEGFGRIASQAARQVIVQKIQETEKEKIFNLFKDKEGQIVNLKVELVEKNRVIFDYNGTQVVLPKSEQVSKDRYVPGQRMYLYVARIEEDTMTGPRVVLTRREKELVVKLFEANVPELEEGSVEIVSIARIPGLKTKLIAATEYDEIDPAGSLIGPKGIRVKSVVDELFGEKVDIINYVPDMRELAKKALVPGEVISVDIDENTKTIVAHVTSEEKPKILGKGGTNINLASELLGYKIILETVDLGVPPSDTAGE